MAFDSSSITLAMAKVQFQKSKLITFEYKQIKKEVWHSPEFTGHVYKVW